MSNGRDEGDFGGWATTFDDERVALSKSEAESLWEQVNATNAARREAIPDSMAAIQILQDAIVRLRDEGWSEGIYCPKDGSDFALITFGSTDIFSGFYSGTWLNGHIITGDYLQRPEGALWKPIDKLTAPEQERLEQCEENDRRMREAEARRFAAMTEDTNQ